MTEVMIKLHECTGTSSALTWLYVWHNIFSHDVLLSVMATNTHPPVAIPNLSEITLLNFSVQSSALSQGPVKIGKQYHKILLNIMKKTPSFKFNIK